MEPGPGLRSTKRAQPRGTKFQEWGQDQRQSQGSEVKEDALKSAADSGAPMGRSKTSPLSKNQTQERQSTRKGEAT